MGGSQQTKENEEKEVMQMRSEQIGDLAKGMHIFRKQLKQPMKDANNPFFKANYVPLENVTEAIDEAIAGTGLAYISEPKGNIMYTLIMHDSGQFMYIEGSPIVVGGKKDAQAYGSALSYARRYSLSTAFGISSDKDDDGNGASYASSPQQIKSQPRQRQPQKPAQNKPVQTSRSIMVRAKELNYPDLDALLLLGDEKATQVMVEFKESLGK